MKLEWLKCKSLKFCFEWGNRGMYVLMLNGVWAWNSVKKWFWREEEFTKYEIERLIIMQGWMERCGFGWLYIFGWRNCLKKLLKICYCAGVRKFVFSKKRVPEGLEGWNAVFCSSGQQWFNYVLQCVLKFVSWKKKKLKTDFW